MTEEVRADGRWEYGVTCVEYTELQKQGIQENAMCNGSLQSPFPANTNVLYVDLAAVEAVASSSREATLPGLIMNLTKAVKYADYRGVNHRCPNWQGGRVAGVGGVWTDTGVCGEGGSSVRAGRMECTMQNIADSLRDVTDRQLGPGEKGRPPQPPHTEPVRKPTAVSWVRVQIISRLLSSSTIAAR